MAAPIDLEATFLYFQERSGKKLQTENNGPTLDIGNGKKIIGFSNIAKHLLRVSEESKFLTLEDRMAAEQWIEYARTEVSYDKDTDKVILKELNTYFQDKVYFVANRLTMADIIVFHSVHPMFKHLTFHEKEKYMNVSRWFNNIQKDRQVKQQLSSITFLRTPVYDG